MESNEYTQHISQQFNVELEEVKTHMLEMGGIVERQVSEAIKALSEVDSGLAKAVIENDDSVNDLESNIDEECALILARRSPTASDLRLVLAIIRTISDLERMGDEAGKIARQAIEISEADVSLKGKGVEIRHIGAIVLEMLHKALDAFARMDEELALEVAREDKNVDLEYGTAMRSLITLMMEDPRTITRVLNIMWALRSLERVGDHARNIAEHVIYLVKGADVRHVGLKEMANQIAND